MGLLEYYILVNLYILFFWIFFHFLLRNEKAFQQLRMYLIASVFVSAILPFLHISSQSFSFIYHQIPGSLSFIENTPTPFEFLMPKASDKLDFEYALIMKWLIVAGAIVFIMVNLVRHLKIHALMHQSESIRYRDVYIKRTKKQIIPFLYNRSIIVPETITKEEMNIVVAHEYQHYRLGHFIDNFFMQIFQIIFWMNPSIYLLIRDLKQTHEYQVDQNIIRSGIDASIYKLTLIKYSVGFQKFAIANGLSVSKIKNRIIMMDNLNIKKSKWKFLLFIPAFFVVFFIFSFTTSVQDSLSKSSDQQNINQDIIELTPISYEAISANRSDYIIVMINFKSLLLFDGEKCTLNEIGEKISNSFHRKVSDVYPQLNSNLLSNSSSKIKFVIQKSTRTNQNDYEMLLDYLSKSIIGLQESYSNTLFGKSYHLLDASEKGVLNNLIQSRIYTLPDKNI